MISFKNIYFLYSKIRNLKIFYIYFDMSHTLKMHSSNKYYQVATHINKNTIKKEFFIIYVNMRTRPM
jgi:hypothetical protein